MVKDGIVGYADNSVLNAVSGANSRDVAAYFEKNHRDVLRSIDDLIVQAPELGMRDFAQTPFVDPQNGQTYRSYDMDRDGFTLLAVSFIGPKALKFTSCSCPWNSYHRLYGTMHSTIRRS